MESGITVSYTHLSGSIVLTNEQIAKLKEVESASDRVISPLQSLEANLPGAVNYPVSYTHLDVYKRQAQDSSEPYPLR